MNNIVIVGNLVNDPAQREVNGSKVTEFRVAAKRRFKKDGQTVTDFYKVTAWRQLADICFQYLKKGRKVSVVGELQARTYEDREGVTRMSLDVAADNVEFMSGSSDKTEETEQPKAAYKEEDFKDIQTDDIPF